jgi:uncharacterized damage-inducible protein DinB
MITTTINTLQELATVLIEIGSENYAKPITCLSNCSIGQHTRHIIEMYQCLNNGYQSAELSYDKRERNKKIETDLNYALQTIKNICNEIDKENISMQSIYLLNDTEVKIETNYHRELMYNLEHCIHHQALIRVGIEQISTHKLSKNFGVAPSTIIYREQCAQ